MNLNLIHHKFFNDVQSNLIQIQTLLKQKKSEQSLRLSENVRCTAAKMSNLEPTKRTTADQFLIFSKLETFTKGNTLNLKDSLNCEVERLFENKIKKVLERLSKSTQHRWISNESKSISLENRAFLRPSAKGKHNQLDLQSKIFGELHKCPDLEKIIETDLNHVIRSELDTYSKNITESCSLFLVSLFESVKDSMDFVEQLKSFVESLEVDIIRSFRKVFAYGPKGVKFRLSDGSLDTRLVLFKFLHEKRTLL